ncbi:MAG: hypothetical protein EA362_09800 [Saprospirales bacterium]|nr:MAG: hypothetical protein EA362_09800 [Saprospirales bacterium]
MRLKNRYISLLFLGFIFINACHPSNPAPDYYFPLPELGNAYVYHYYAETEGFPNEYWLIKRIGDRQLRICIYDDFRGWNQCSYEYLAASGVIQDSVLLFDRDGMVNRVEVEYGNLYPREKLDTNMVFLQYLRWYNDPDSITFTEVIRNRRIIQTSVAGENELTFHLLESIEDFQEGYLSIEAEGREVFKKGKGLMFFTKEIGEVSRTYTFKEELSVENFEKRIGQKIPEF